MIRSGGGRLERHVDNDGQPGDVYIVLDRDGQEIGRGVAMVGPILVRFDPPVKLPPAGDLYDVRRVPNEKAAPDFLDAVGMYLRSVGWTAVLAGPVHIEHTPGDLEYKFRLVVGFVGGPKEAKDDSQGEGRVRGAVGGGEEAQPAVPDEG